MGKHRGALSGLARFLPASNEDSAVDQPESDVRPAKKRKTESVAPKYSESQWIQNYDATGLVPHYTHASEVPEHLQKYFAQRTRFLSLYSSPPGCLLDEEGWYSITPELVADRIAERCRCDTILDAFCGVGGNAIAFAKTCERVIALDISPTRLALARHNAQIYGVADRIEFVLSDYISFANAYLSTRSGTSPRKIDVVFLSPPWGGPSYISGDTRPSSPVKPAAEQPPVHPTYTLASIQPVHGAELFHLSRRITRNIAYYLPRNTQLEEISALLADPPESGVDVGDKREMVEVEEEWMGSKLKALTCYFGGLADGQPELFDA
ncbi:S-adenosyl-L-methionine-dependent methyltransferase [Mycena albidolilacea]|uniref:Trimethylguanosine synthase n=1 Tax=Mycena albidolilacea TaxID=1033008 RepID=A0AAD7EY86_9AGAR|nr:S-adenosyl-L-methionine-dependent methyltransferase [Mycena albidolilacea]